MMFGHLFRKKNLMSLVAIFTQPTALLQKGYLEPGIMNYTKRKIVLCTWNIKGKDLTTAVKPVWDLVCEKCVYLKPKSKSVKLVNDK